MLMKQKTQGVFVLFDCTKYEGCVPLYAFRERKAAEHLKAAAEEYDEKMPQCPTGIGAEEWEIYESKSKEWKNNHPIGKDFDGADYYSIANVPFFA